MVWRFLRRYFLTGVLVLLPVIITVYILVFAFNLVDGILRNLIQSIAGRYIPGLGLLIILVMILLAGVIGTNVVGRKFLNIGEQLFERLPVVKSIYTAVKQVMEVLTTQRRAAFRHVVLVEYPRRGIYSLGFITGEAPFEVKEEVAEDLLNVYLPTTPPTQGVFIMVPRSEVRILNMSVEDGFKLLVSAGIITSSPSYLHRQKPSRRWGGDIPIYRRAPDSGES
ncbi:MAG: hypothetical protein PWQ99_875 [Clostridia bacterium]|jgi:uncharacterized membrane protein|nr:hypothetical protein [Clostridia bacterium]MDN5375860.1 hypothetical protein [Thermacetogenium sp.]